jgi:hypothetical protein
MVGGWIWKPNADGLHWFFEQVYPHLPATISIQVAGRGADWLRDRYPNVTYWGFVEDARTFRQRRGRSRFPLFWTRDRRARFLQDVDTALNAL